MPRRFSHVRLDGTIQIITLAEGTPEQQERFLAKTLFELNRRDMGLDPSIHFDDYTGPQTWEAREITVEALPNRARRHAWRERIVNGKPQIFVDPAV